jgi:hypothetical protein
MLHRAWLGVVVAALGAFGAEPPRNQRDAEILSRFVRDMPWEEHLSDAVLIARFAEGKKSLEELRGMFLHDRGLRLIDAERTEPADVHALGISEKRLVRYRQLLRELKLKFVYGRADKTGGASFVVTSRGLSVSGSSKGYAWLPSRPERLAANLDTYVRDMLAKKEAARTKEDGMAASGYTVYRPLEGQWYLFYSN